MVGHAAQGNPWVLEEIVDGGGREASREEVVAELVLFIRETVRELGERRASGFLKKFYAWYLGRGRFPRPFKQELVVLDSTEEVERRLIAAAPGWLELIGAWRRRFRRARTSPSSSRSRSTAGAGGPAHSPSPYDGRAVGPHERHSDAEPDEDRPADVR